MRSLFGWVRKLKDWTEGFAQKSHATWSLFVISFMESSFFPIPPDVLLIALGVMRPKRSFFYATICSLGSIMGGVLGYLIGYSFYELIGVPIINFYHAHEAFENVRQLYEQNAFLYIAIAGFTPIPYKVFTIAAGVFEIHLMTLVLASAISRSARFFLVSGMFYFFGAPIKRVIDKYFEVFTVAFVVLLVLGFVVIKYLL